MTNDAKAAPGEGAFGVPRSGPLLVVLSGPSGAGKDSVLAELKRRSAPYHFTVTATTRAPRSGERHGVDYYFLAVAEFEALLATAGLIEHVLYDGTYRGVPRRQVVEALAAGRDVIMRTDVRGALTIKRLAPGATLILVCPPSLQALRARMLRRGSETPESLAQRLALAAEEMRALPEFDYAVLNDEDGLASVADQVQAIIIAERCRVGRQPVQL